MCHKLLDYCQFRQTMLKYSYQQGGQTDESSPPFLNRLDMHAVRTLRLIHAKAGYRYIILAPAVRMTESIGVHGFPIIS